MGHDATVLLLHCRRSDTRQIPGRHPGLRRFWPVQGRVGENGPTIDSIEVVEFETNDALKEWLKQKAPGFLPAGG